MCKKRSTYNIHIDEAFHILPAVYAKECSIMFVHEAGKINLRILVQVLFVLIDKLICSKSILMRLCIIIYKIISLDILTRKYNICIFNNDKR